MKELGQEIHYMPRPGLISQPLCVGAKVVLEKNLWFNGRLLNGTIGNVLEIKFKNSPPDPNELPEYVLVDFKNYMGTELYTSGNLQGVPIVPILDEEQAKLKKSKLAKYIPLRGAYGITVHKTQSLTLPKAAVYLGDYEIFPSVDFVSFSRVKKLTYLAVLDRELSEHRLVYGPNTETQAIKYFHDQVWEQRRLEGIALLDSKSSHASLCTPEQAEYAKALIRGTGK